GGGWGGGPCACRAQEAKPNCAEQRQIGALRRWAYAPYLPHPTLSPCRGAWGEGARGLLGSGKAAEHHVGRARVVARGGDAAGPQLGGGGALEGHDVVLAPAPGTLL